MNFEDELINDFFNEYAKLQDDIEIILRVWQASQQDDEAINRLFRAIHTIKGNLFIMNLDDLGHAVHALENYLSKLRAHTIHQADGIDVLISLVIEQCKELAKQSIAGHNKKDKIKRLSIAISNLNEVTNLDDAHLVLLNSLQILDDIDECGEDYSLQKLINFLKKVDHKQEESHHKIKELKFFYKLILQIEAHFPFWLQRSDTILKLVQAMNELAGSPVDAVQLQAAVYIHDVGMSFIPPQKFYVSTRVLGENDIKLMHLHCEMGSQWLNVIPGWADAALMVAQHHERFDSLGYPNQLEGEEICDGAKLLAIGDTYASIIAKSKKGNQKKPIMFAVSEINKGSGLQFDPKWVEIFNTVIRKHLTSQA